MSSFPVPMTIPSNSRYANEANKLYKELIEKSSYSEAYIVAALLGARDTEHSFMESLRSRHKRAMIGDQVSMRKCSQCGYEIDDSVKQDSELCMDCISDNALASCNDKY